MEVSTCEQYVLRQLFEQQDENDRILAEVERMRAALKEARDTLAVMERRAESPIATAIRAAGRWAVVERATWGCQIVDVERDGVAVPWAEWADQAIIPDELPEGVAPSEFIDEFKPELRKLYEDQVAK